VSERHQHLIIESPGLQRPLPRNGWKLVTALFWAAWFWIWLPLITAIGWMFGVHTVFDQFVANWGYIELLRLLPYYILIIGITGLLLIGWSLLQMYRFGGVDRRRAAPTVTRLEIATALSLDESTTTSWLQTRRMIAYHDENGRVSWIESADAGQPLPEPQPQPESTAAISRESDVLPIEASAEQAIAETYVITQTNRASSDKLSDYNSQKIDPNALIYVA
jgi:biofilm PGA synthesis protein PgaD